MKVHNKPSPSAIREIDLDVGQKRIGKQYATASNAKTNNDLVTSYVIN